MFEFTLKPQIWKNSITFKLGRDNFHDVVSSPPSSFTSRQSPSLSLLHKQINTLSHSLTNVRITYTHREEAKEYKDKYRKNLQHSVGEIEDGRESHHVHSLSYTEGERAKVRTESPVPACRVCVVHFTYDRERRENVGHGKEGRATSRKHGIHLTKCTNVLREQQSNRVENESLFTFPNHGLNAKLMVVTLLFEFHL